MALGMFLAGLSLALATANAQTGTQAPETHDLAYEAWLTLKARCGSCHLPPSHKPTTPPLPALRSLSTLAASRRLVVAGRPDHSALIWRMLDGHDKPRTDQETHVSNADETEPAPENSNRRAIPPGVTLVRDWIARLPHKPAALTYGTRNVLPTTDAGSGGLRVDVVQNRFKVGDQIVYRVQAGSACRLSLINVDPRGVATVVFPNAYARAARIDAAAALEIPAADDPFMFTAKRRGIEKLIALCSGGAGAALGIRHDFVHQRFTVLGDWERFLATGRPPRPQYDRNARRRWRYRRVRRCYRYKRRGRTVRRCRWRRRRIGRVRPKPLGPLPPARLRAVAVVAVEVR